MSESTASLKVSEAYTRDVGRGVARIDYDSMESIGASTGDIIEISGKRRTVGRCLPLYPTDEGKGTIRVDGLVRNNAGIAIDDIVSIKKIMSVHAENITVIPLQEIPPIEARYLTDALEGIPLIKGDNLLVPYFGGRLAFQIIGVKPIASALLVTPKTVFEIKEGIEHEAMKISVSNPTLSSNKRSQPLTVRDSYTVDASQRVSRIDASVMSSINGVEGDFVAIIKGPQMAITKCLLLYNADWEGIIRLDKETLSIANIEVGDTVTVQKIKVEDAQNVTLISLEGTQPIDPNQLRDLLLGIVLVNGATITVPNYDGSNKFHVKDTLPDSEAVIVRSTTNFEISTIHETEKLEAKESFETQSISTGTSQVLVAGSKRNDLYQGIARINENYMLLLGLKKDDIIEIKGYCRTVARCLPLENNDEKEIIRIDDVIRFNAGTAVGEKVTVTRLTKENAVEVVVMPIDEVHPVDNEFLASALDNIPVIEGDLVSIPHFGQRKRFKVLSITPKADSSLITTKTIFSILHDEKIIFENKFSHSTPSADEPDAPKWMYDCLDEAKKIIIEHHKTLDPREFLEKCEFRIFIQTDKPSAYGYVRLGMHPKYNIGIHKILSQYDKKNVGMVTIILVHELLHTIHPEDQNHSIVTPLEKVFANKAGYFDALKEMELLSINGKMRFCED